MGSQDSQQSNKWREMAIISAWIISGAGVGIFALTIPFVVPAFRRHCLPYVPATPVQIQRVLGYLRPGRMVDLGSGDGRVVSFNGYSVLCMHKY